MRVLITSGGTRAPFDEVRWIGNSSTGRFGVRLVLAALAREAEVTHLVAEQAAAPFERTVDLAGDLPRQWAALEREAARLAPMRDRYRAVSFTDPESYGRSLERLLREDRFDVAILAAAVSDYAPTAQTGKISSGTEELRVTLRPVPKFIGRVKDWAPDVYLVGVKLLAGASEEELTRAALALGRASRADAIVANDMREVRADRHAIHVVREGRPIETFGPEDEPAEHLIERVFAWAAEPGSGP